MALALALAYIFVPDTPDADIGKLWLALALIYTIILSVLIVKQVRFSMWFIWLDASIVGSLIFLTQGSGSQYIMYSIAPIPLAASLFQISGGLISAAIITCFSIVGIYISGNLDFRLPVGYDTLGYLSYLLSLFIIAIFFAYISSLLGRHRKTTAQLEGHIETLSSIYEVASGISSKFFLDDILESVVDQAKQIIKTDKTVLHLVDSRTKSKHLRQHMVAVRGSRSEHPESWWHAQIQDVAEEVLQSGGERLISRTPGPEDAHGSWLLCVPVKIKDKPVGILSAINSYDKKFSENDIAALAILASFAAVAIDNARLINKAQLLLVADERGRIAKDMHDGLAQSLFSLVLNLQVCQKLIEKDPLTVKNKVIEMQSVASQGLTEIRRYIYDLRPKNLEEMGLIGAIDFHIKEISKLNGTTGRLRIYGKRCSLPARAESCIYRVVQEATNNIVKHSKADRFNVSLKYADNEVELLIKDKGQGFDVEKAVADADSRKTFGLLSMRERIAEQNGEIAIKSSPKNGTEIRVCLPLPNK